MPRPRWTCAFRWRRDCAGTLWRGLGAAGNLVYNQSPPSYSVGLRPDFTWRRLVAALGWTRSSYILLSAFLATLFVIGVVWWPLAKEALEYVDWNRPLWHQVDWLLLGVFAAMSLLIMAGADLKADALIVLVGLAGGLVIESWGTQTELWTYYTLERPPLWIIPAWPIASLSIDRLARLLQRLVPSLPRAVVRGAYLPALAAFYALMLVFVWPAAGQSLTLASLALCALLILTPTDHRMALLTFAAGAGLGYFLERWGTTRLCWTYYTRQAPPLFAVLAHGMAAVAFWRTGLLVRQVLGRLVSGLRLRRNSRYEEARRRETGGAG